MNLKKLLVITLLMMIPVVSEAGIQSMYWKANNSTAMTAVKDGNFQKAEEEYKIALRRAKNHLGEEEISDSLYNLGQFLRKRGRILEAINHLLDSLEVERKVSNETSLRSGRRIAELSMAYLMGDNINEARPLVERLKNIPFSGREKEVSELIISQFNRMMKTSPTVTDGMTTEENKDPKKVFEMAAQYEDGRGVKQDFQEAIRLYKLSATKGYAHAQYYLGVIYDKGRGVDKDDAEARKWYQKAAQNGHARAQFNYAVFLLQGRGGKQDESEAKQFLVLSSKQGHETATQVLKKYF